VTRAQFAVALVLAGLIGPKWDDPSGKPIQGAASAQEAPTTTPAQGSDADGVTLEQAYEWAMRM
jgi:hypothetical protein